MKIDYNIADVAPYVNWSYFFHAWGVSGKPQTVKDKLRQDAEQRLQRHAADFRTHAIFRLFSAVSDGDDIVLTDSGQRLPMLRQQQEGSDFLSLADFISPQDSPTTSLLGLFATTVDMGMETSFAADPYEQMMMQLLADRLAEATAELLHQEVRQRYWGYAPDEQLTIPEMLVERFQGIRPAVGYPSLPDTSLNFVLDQLLDLKQIGIRLTESGAMKPHASVSGLMIAHPQARYFALGRIGHDQLADYARRRGLPVEVVRKFIGGNL